jgi:hypothetical protein
MKVTTETTILPCLILASIYTNIILKYELIQINYSETGLYFPIIFIFIFCYGNTIVFSNYFLEKFCYAKTNKHCYILIKDFNKIESDETTLFCNYYIKEIPNLERFVKLQNFTLKLDLTGNSEYFNNTNKLLYKLNVHKLPKLNIFEIKLSNKNKVKTISHDNIKILHKDNYYMANPYYINQFPKKVTHINILHSTYFNTKKELFDNLPITLEYLKFCDCDYELTNLPITVKKLVLVKSKINKNYTPTEYCAKDFEHKIPFGCNVQHLYQDFYDYIYDL